MVIYSARGRVARSGIGVEEGEMLVKALWGIVICAWVVWLRPMSIKRTVALLDSIWAFV